MNLSNFSIKRPVTVIMITLVVVLLGMVSLSRLGLDLYPKINVPVAIVSTTYSGTGPQEMESLVTRPIEGVLATVGGVTDISSTSSEGSSLVIMQFGFSTDMDQAALEIREKVDMIASYLPEGATEPGVYKIDPNAFPIMMITVSGDAELSDIQTTVEDKIVSRLERIEGVARVTVTGGITNEVLVQIDQNKLDSYGLSYSQLKSILVSENINLPSGKIDRGNKSIPLRIIGEFESVQDISNIPLLLPNGSVIRLKDVADVSLKPEETYQLITVDDEQSIGVSILKSTDANTVQVANAINEELMEIDSEFDKVNIEIIMDNSVFIESAISNVATSGIIGGLLAVIILYLFLRNIRTTLVIGVSIPVSVIGTFALMYFSGITMNLMTLGGLALGIGMLVDNSIVVLENIYRFRERGYSQMDAAREGTAEVSTAIVASTLTTVAVFLPIVFVEGVTSLLFKELALTVSFSLVMSLLVSLTVVPMLSSQILKIDNRSKEKHHFSGFQKGFSGFQKIYEKIIRAAVTHRLTTLGLAIGVFIISIFTATNLGAEFIPAMDEGSVGVTINLPESSQFEETVALTKSLEEQIKNIPEIDTIYTTIGVSGMSFISSSDTSTASMTINLVPLSEREKSSSDIADEIRKLYKNIPGADIQVSASQTQGFGGTSSPISIQIRGDNLDVLKQYSDEIKVMIENIDGTREVTSSLEEGKDEIVLKIDRDKASQYGMTAAAITQYVRDIVYGNTLSQYKSDGQEISIKVIGPEKYRESMASLANLPIETPYGPVVLSEFIDTFEIVQSPSQIMRDSQVRVATIGSNIYGRDLQSVSTDIESELSKLTLPSGYSYEIGGQTQELAESFSSLGLALVLAILLIYMVMASQFENLVYPFIIMFSVPFAVSGSIFGLAITNRPISVPAFIGLIMLAGIVVNNAIVLVDYINTLRSQGEKLIDAVVTAAQTRLRPILMTMLTTVLGLLPMAIGIGDGAETTAPLATVVIGGLLFSTVLTLVVIPTVYVLFNRKALKAEQG